MQPNLEEDKAAKIESHLHTPQHNQSSLRNPWLQIPLSVLQNMSVSLD